MLSVNAALEIRPDAYLICNRIYPLDDLSTSVLKSNAIVPDLSSQSTTFLTSIWDKWHYFMKAIIIRVWIDVMLALGVKVSS